MKLVRLPELQCPSCQGDLSVAANATMRNGEVFEGLLQCKSCAARFPVRNYIPRLLRTPDNYSDSWGKLWRETGALLRDSSTGIPFHRDTIHGYFDPQATVVSGAGASMFGFEWPTELHGQHVLEVGPGTGNCTEILVQTGATLTCVDMSNAIDTFPEALLTHPNILVVQADINDGILSPQSYDRIWLFQVLQHTPDPAATLAMMYGYLRSGGELAVTSYYGKGPWTAWYYPLTRAIPDDRAWELIARWVPRLVQTKYRVTKIGIPLFTRLARKLLEPIDPRDIYYDTLEGRAHHTLHGAMYDRNHDLQALKHFAAINTFDRITCRYTNSATHEDIERWCRTAGFTAVRTWGVGGVRARAVR